MRTTKRLAPGGPLTPGRFELLETDACAAPGLKSAGRVYVDSPVAEFQ